MKQDAHRLLKSLNERRAAFILLQVAGLENAISFVESCKNIRESNSVQEIGKYENQNE